MSHFGGVVLGIFSIFHNKHPLFQALAAKMPMWPCLHPLAVRNARPLEVVLGWLSTLLAGSFDFSLLRLSRLGSENCSTPGGWVDGVGDHLIARWKLLLVAPNKKSMGIQFKVKVFNWGFWLRFDMRNGCSIQSVQSRVSDKCFSSAFPRPNSTWVAD